MLSQRDFYLNKLSGKYGSALQAACARGNLSTVKFLVDSGADLTFKVVIMEEQYLLPYILGVATLK